MRRWPTVALCLALLPGAAAAQSPPEQTQTLVDSATARFKAAEYAAALAGYEEALAQTSDRRLHYMIGRCQEELGRPAEALASFEAFLVGDAPPDARERALEHIRAVRAQLEVGKLHVEVDPPGAEVLVDGAVVGTGPELHLDVQAGERTVEVRAIGYEARSRKVAVPGAGSAVVAVALAPQAITAPGPVAVVEGADDGGATELATWGWSMLGTGAALMVGGTVTVLAGESDHKDIVSAPGYESGGAVQMSRERALELESRGDDLKTAGYVLFGVGGAALATAATLLVIDSQSTPGVTFGAGPTAGGAGAFVGGTF